ncbi:MAG: hypothetical protein DMF60_10925 [Acidobacteria bacterium]|nr:MAG: hypothetical protein DMF60_10925 [Acidobacteriota bacterium]
MSRRQKWNKLGLIFAPPENLGWVHTHAALPVADRINDAYRIYFSGRDKIGRAQIGFFEIELKNPNQILRVSKEPVIGLGPLGAFDDSGVTTSWIVSHEGRKYHYYSGWSLGITVPFYFYIGMAVSDDGGETYRKVSAAPILERNHIDPYLTASPCVLVEGGTWKMWYVSCTGWEIKNGQPQHYYHIKYAESSDGIRWRRDGLVCIDYTSRSEYAIARPCVLKEDGVYKMWYSHREGKGSYRVGYAESADGLYWERRDEESGIEISASGWDSEMIAYPFVFGDKDKRYMLYNGNGYGKTGIGLAVLDQSEK